MSDLIIADMRERLGKLREDIQSLAAISDESSQVVELDQSRIGRLSRIDAMRAQAMAQAVGWRRKSMLRKIAAALARIDNGEYGLCRSCEEPIHRKRLEFDPTVLLCTQCATKAEQ